MLQSELLGSARAKRDMIESARLHDGRDERGWRAGQFAVAVPDLRCPVRLVGGELVGIKTVLRR